MEQVGFLAGFLFAHVVDYLQFQKDVRESFVVVGADMQAVIDRLDALEHNQDLKMAQMIAPRGEA